MIPTSEWWWRLIAGRILLLILLIGLIATDFYLIPTFELPIWIHISLGAIYLLLTLLSAIGVHFDRQRVSDLSGWSPSGLYYLMAVPFSLIADVIAIVYLFNRHRYVGVP